MLSSKMKKSTMLKALILSAFLLLMLFTPVSSHAAQDYTTRQFNVDVKITKDHVIHVQETIQVYFIGQHHGIIRYIPESEGDYFIKNLTCSGETYETYTETSSGHKFQVIRIGSSDRYQTGLRKYKLSYDLYGIKDRNENADTLSLDLLPTSWETAIQSSHITVSMPSDVDPSAYKFYLGTYGDSHEADSLNKHVSSSGRKITISVKNLSQGVGLTVRAKLKEGYWQNEADRSSFVYMILGISGAFTLIILLLWFTLGRDPKTVPVVNFYPPDDMTPADVGYVADGSVDAVDISSMIMYYAAKGYLKIEEPKKKVIKISKVKDIDKGAESERTVYLFNKLFSKGKTFYADTGGGLTSDSADAFRIQTENFFEKKLHGFYSSGSKAARVISVLLIAVQLALIVILGELASYTSIEWIPIGLAVVMTMIGLSMIISAQARAHTAKKRRTAGLLVGGGILYILGAAAAIFTAEYSIQTVYGNGYDMILTLPLIIMFLVEGYFTVYMKARTKECVDLLGQVEGFRNFIRDAEYQRLKTLSDEDPSYFYEIMPYAMVLGMGTKFSKKFEKIRVEPPDWYTGPNVMDVFIYSAVFNSIASQTSAVTDIFENAGGGGFDFGGGGGFSGGGFGGGGGGAW